jgi:hypothetical protein
MEAPSPRPPPISAPAPAPGGPPRALQSLADAVRLAHAHFLVLFPLALAVDWTLEAAVTLATGGGPGALYRVLLASLLERDPLAGDGPLFLAVVVAALDAFLPTLIATACLARAVRAILRGRTVRPLESFAAGLRRLPVALATAVAFSIVPVAVTWLPWKFGRDYLPVPLRAGLFFGAPLFVLLIAAIIARFALATPAAVLERRGLIGAWRRSERLIEGSMWRVVGLVVVVGVLWVVFVRGFAGGGVVALAEQWAPPASGHAKPGAAAIALAFFRSALEAWFHLVVGVVATILFERLRRAKEGPDADELQQVFA